MGALTVGGAVKRGAVLLSLALTGCARPASPEEGELSYAPVRVLHWTLTHEVHPVRAEEETRLRLVLPRDVMDRQEILELTLDPEPDTIRTVAGRRYADYAWPSDGAAQRVVFAGRARVHPVGLGAPGFAVEGGPAAIATWERAARLIESDEERIVALARTAGDRSGLALVRELARCVRDRLEPDPERELGGALRALEAGRADCDGYSDLLVALLRARGVAARTVSGVANIGSHPFHAWTEVLIAGRWRALDLLAAETLGGSIDASPLSYLRFNTVREDPALGGTTLNWVEGPPGTRMTLSYSLRVEP